MADIQKAIRMLLETGKADFGARGARNHALRGTAKMILVAGNCPKALKDEILNNCSKSGIQCMETAFTSLELGSACGRPFPVSALSVIDAGNSDILKAASGEATEETAEERAAAEAEKAAEKAAKAEKKSRKAKEKSAGEKAEEETGTE